MLDGNLDLTTDEIEEAGQDRAATATANFLVHNPVSQREQTLFGEVLSRAVHRNGPGWSNTLNRNMRQQNAHQRARNTGPHGLNNTGTIVAGNNTYIAILLLHLLLRLLLDMLLHLLLHLLLLHLLVLVLVAGILI